MDATHNPHSSARATNLRLTLRLLEYMTLILVPPQPPTTGDSPRSWHNGAVTKQLLWRAGPAPPKARGKEAVQQHKDQGSPSSHRLATSNDLSATPADLAAARQLPSHSAIPGASAREGGGPLLERGVWVRRYWPLHSTRRVYVAAEHFRSLRPGAAHKHQIGDQGMQAIAGALQRGCCPELECLDLTDCDLTAAGARTLSLSFTGTPILKFLGFSPLNAPRAAMLGDFGSTKGTRD